MFFFSILCMYSFSAVGQQWHSNVVQNLHVGNYLPQVKYRHLFPYCVVYVVRLRLYFGYIIHIALCSVMIAVFQFLASKFSYQRINGFLKIAK